MLKKVKNTVRGLGGNESWGLQDGRAEERSGSESNMQEVLNAKTVF